MTWVRGVIIKLQKGFQVAPTLTVNATGYQCPANMHLSLTHNGLDILHKLHSSFGFDLKSNSIAT